MNRLELINSVKSQPDKQSQWIREMLPIAEATLFDYPLCDNLVYKVLNSIKGQVPVSKEAREQLAVFSKCDKKN